jgi:hypothetical protein
MARIPKYKLSELKEAGLGNPDTSDVEVFEVTTASAFILSVITKIDETEYDIRIEVDDIFEHISSENETEWVKKNAVKTNCIVDTDDVSGAVRTIPIHIYFEENKYKLLTELITKNLI